MGKFSLYSENINIQTAENKKSELNFGLINNRRGTKTTYSTW